MSTSSQTTIGAAILCDLNGIVRRIARDEIGITGASAPGTEFVDLVDHDSREKAAHFIQAIRDRGAVFDWELNAFSAGRIVLLHCMGCCQGNLLWVIMAKTPFGTTRILEEMSLIQNEQSTMLRGVFKEAAVRGARLQSDSHFDDLTRLYNDLGLMQRELAQRNAELESLRAKLEVKQTELIAANNQLEALASTDGLTGIANRRAFDFRLETERLRYNRYRTPLALMILDVDQFKSFNDLFGHLAGDEVLKRMGKLLAASARNTDFVARYGGEEFAVILPNTEESAAKGAAERLRVMIESAPWPLRPITASIGIASWNSGADTASQVILRADTALYHSKHHGRNRATHFLDMPLAA